MRLLWEDRAWSEYLYWQTQDKKTLKRINALIKDIQRSPYQGIGKPEPLLAFCRGIQAGAPADIVIFGENEEWTVEHFHSKASNSPFFGWTLPGKLHYTICNGKIVAEN